MTTFDASSQGQTGDVANRDNAEADLPPRNATRSDAASHDAIIRGDATRWDRWILLCCAALLLWNLNYASFGNPDEGRYASAALEMARPFDGSPADWIVPHLNTIPRLNKPPLVYWLAAASFHAFGAHEWAGRLVPALCAVAVLLMIWAMGRAMFGRRAAVLGALVWATSLFSFGLARLLNTDMPLCAAMTLGLWGIWRTLENAQSDHAQSENARAIASRSDTKGRRDEEKPREDPSRPPHEYSWAGAILAGIGLGLALLAKGPVGMALPLLVTFVYLCAARRWHRVPWGRVLCALVLAIAIAAPWYAAVAAREPDFLRRFFLQENLGRFSGKAEFHQKSPFYYYIPIVLVGMLPWTPFLFFAALRAKRRDAATESEGMVANGAVANGAVANGAVANVTDARASETDHASRSRLFLWLWAGALVLLFSASGTKLPTYVLPAFPALALLAGEAMDDLLRGRAPRLKHLAPRIFLGFTLFLNAVLAFAALRFLSDGKILPRREGQSFAVWCVCVLLAGSLLSLWAWKKRHHPGAAAAAAVDAAAETGRWKRLIGAQALTMALLYMSLLHFAQRFTLYEDAGPMIQALAPYVQRDDLFVEFRTTQFTPIFHLARPVEFVGFNNNSGLDEAMIARSPFFARGKNHTLFDVLSDSRRVWVLMRRDARGTLPRGAFLVARNSDLQLLSNRPAPAGFSFDHVAPGKVMR